MSKLVRVSDLMQKNYAYQLSESVGENFDTRFKPDLTPAQMLALGVFGGVYLRDCGEEFPADDFEFGGGRGEERFEGAPLFFACR